MLDVRTQKAEEIFCDAIELANAVERNAFVEQACGEDGDLRAEVDQMLKTQATAEAFFRNSSLALEPPLESIALAADGSALRGADGMEGALDEKPGTRIGPYKLLQKIGEGGCGAVYMAEQDVPVRRRVALKILKLGMDTKSVLARFRAEQQALALMDHPNIAQVHDAGVTDKGRPYFIMELVRGIKLTTYCDEHQLDNCQRLGLFIQVCHAIQHAHQKGIIHRDIKPSNILVTIHDGVPLPKVIDFGIAKAIEGKLSDETYNTAYGQFIGTPAYMSPEQAESSALDVDTRSDIYSLGVLLYELLTGKTPFDATKLLQTGVDELRRTLRESEPKRPSAAVATLQADELTRTAQSHHAEPAKMFSALRGDLDWIVMKALEKDRDRRYQTANGLALDVQRYLDNEPILARPPGQLYRLRKLVRRNKIVFAAGSITVLALIASSGISTWLLVKERLARQRALMAEQMKGTLEDEARVLRANAESRKKLSKALALYGSGKRDQADAILDGVSNPPPESEYSTMFRALGDWHVTGRRWAKAKARFDALAQINEIENGDTTMDDFRSSSLLVDQGYVREYERFRESLVARYTGTDDPTVAQRTLRICLLTPATEEMLGALERFARTVEKSINAVKPGQTPAGAYWQTYALALMSYRRGDYETALKWCRHTRTSGTGFITRDLSIQLIEAMTRKQLGQDDEAKEELNTCRSAIAKASKPGTTSRDWQGFWFDQTCVQIHLREAADLIEGGPQSSN